MVLLLVVALQVAQPPAPPPTGLILGRVVDATSGRPISGAIVTLLGGALVGTAGMPLATTQPRAMTNANGQFVFRKLPKGTFSLTATRAGYADGAYGRRRPGGTAGSLQLDDGQRVGDAVIRIWRQASISGTVTDEAGEPMVAVALRLFERRTTAGKRRFVPGRTAMTDDRGYYRFSGLTPGDYVLAFTSRVVTMPAAVIEAARMPTAPNDKAAQQLQRDRGMLGAFVGPPGSGSSVQVGDTVRQLGFQEPVPPVSDDPGAPVYAYPTVFFPNATSASRATVIALESGQERDGVDLSLRPVHSLRVSGVVMGSEGPAANMPLRLMPAGDDSSSALEVSATMADANGNFTFLGVTPGQYAIRGMRIPPTPTPSNLMMTQIQVGGSMMVSGGSANAAPPAIPDDPAFYVTADVEVGEADVKDLVVALQRGGRLTGHVEFEGSRDRPDAATLVRTPVMVESIEGSVAGPFGVPPGRVDENGSFKTYGLAPGKYLLRVGGSPSGWTLKSVTIEGRDISDVPFVIGSTDIANVVITFTDRPTKLTGAAHTKDGNPDPDALVVVFPIDPTAWSDTGLNPRRFRSARSLSNGTYTFNGLPPGDYYIAAISDESISQWQDPQVLTELARSATQVRLAEGDTRTQDLVRSGGDR